MKPKAEVMRDLARVRRRKITIQKRETVKDQYGDETVRWVDWRTVWVERCSLWGSDYYAAAAIGEQNTIEFVVRYVPFLEELNTVNFRILYDGEIYDIKYKDYLDDAGMWMKLRALGAG